jgi:hypothetical protein
VVHHVTKSLTSVTATAGRIAERVENAVADDFTGPP